MKQSKIAWFMKAITLAAGVIGAGYIVFLTKKLADIYPFAENGGTKVPAIILGVISAVLCYLILFEFWRVTDNVGKNNTFTRDNVKYFGKMAVLVLALAISWLIFGIAWLIAGYGISLMAVFQLGFDVIIFSGISMLCSIFSKLLEKACEIREENDLTI